MSFENIVDRIGFGCSGLLRVGTSAGRQRLLDTAFDVGIRYFDVARTYGLGKAEKELGKFIERRRSNSNDNIEVATKFGIPLKPTSLVRNVGEVAGRQVLRWFPNFRKRLRKHSANLYLPKDFTVDHAIISLQTSLRELNLERVHTFLLHEPCGGSEFGSELIDWLIEQQTAGTFRTYGVAGYLDQMETSLKDTRWPVHQFQHDVFSPVAEHKNENRSITFGAISNALERCDRILSGNHEIRNAVADHFGEDPLTQNELPAMLLRYNLDCFPDSRTLFSTTKVERIRGVVERLQTLPWHVNSGTFLRSNLLQGLLADSSAA